MGRRIVGLAAAALVAAGVAFVMARRPAATATSERDEVDPTEGVADAPLADTPIPPAAATSTTPPPIPLTPPADAGQLQEVAVASGPDGKDLDVSRNPFGFALWHGQAPSRVGGTSIINGKPTVVAELEVDKPVAEVVRDYTAQLAANHIRPLAGAPLGETGPHYLSYRPWRGGPLKTITVVPHGASSLVLASISAPAAADDFAPPTMPDGLPARADAVGMHVTENQDGVSRQRNVSFLLPHATLDDTATFYSGALAKLGFVAETATWDHRTSSDWRQAFTRGADRLAVAVGSRGQGVAVTLIWVQG